VQIAQINKSRETLPFTTLTDRQHSVYAVTPCTRRQHRRRYLFTYWLHRLTYCVIAGGKRILSFGFTSV